MCLASEISFFLYLKVGFIMFKKKVFSIKNFKYAAFLINLL